MTSISNINGRHATKSTSSIPRHSSSKYLSIGQQESGNTRGKKRSTKRNSAHIASAGMIAGGRNRSPSPRTRKRRHRKKGSRRFHVKKSSSKQRSAESLECALTLNSTATASQAVVLGSGKVQAVLLEWLVDLSVFDHKSSTSNTPRQSVVTTFPAIAISQHQQLASVLLAANGQRAILLSPISGFLCEQPKVQEGQVIRDAEQTLAKLMRRLPSPLDSDEWADPSSLSFNGGECSSAAASFDAAAASCSTQAGDNHSVYMPNPANRSSKGVLLPPLNPTVYDTEPIMDEIRRLEKKRRQLEQTFIKQYGEDSVYNAGSTTASLQFKEMDSELNFRLTEKRKQLLEIYHLLKKREAMRVSGTLAGAMSIVPLEPMYAQLPELGLCPLKFSPTAAEVLEERSVVKEILTIEGPDDDECDEEYDGYAFARSISTYPWDLKEDVREGDPICDCFGLTLFENRAIITVADGCNWGDPPREAARRSVRSFLHHMGRHHESAKTVRDVGRLILESFAQAHNGIIEDKEEIFSAGTATLLGGLMVQVHAKDNSLFETNSILTINNTGEPIISHPFDEITLSSSKNTNSSSSSSSSKNPNNGKNSSTNITNSFDTTRWCFIFATVGDCKAFLFSKRLQRVIDLTAGNRTNVLDARDCGGRLGPMLDHGQPDLRNLALILAPCEQGDILFGCSDGIHDNLDPQALGVEPKDLSLPDKHWKQLDTDLVDKVKNDFRCKFATQTILSSKKKRKKSSSRLSIKKNIPPQLVVSRLTNHCMQTTKAAREFMENHPTQKLPSDYNLYPGKMDHTTILCVVCTKMPRLPDIDPHTPGRTQHTKRIIVP